ncbi:hypothetical protein CN231_25160, partial [Sinorhizobium meliloti]
RVFQPKDLVWLDPCDEHRDEEIKQAAAGIQISRGLSKPARACLLPRHRRTAHERISSRLDRAKNAERAFDAAACGDAACHPASAAASGALPRSGSHASPARYRRVALKILNIFRRFE